MSIRTRSAAAFAAAVLLGSLAACATPTTTGPTDPADISPTPSPTAPADAGPEEIDGVRVGEPFASETAEIPDFETIPGCEWVGAAPRDGYSLTVQRDAEGGDEAPIVLVAVSAPSDQASVAGPTTSEGIGIGSSVDEARTAYPDAEEVPSVGDRRYLKVADAAASALFLSYTEGGGVIWALTATSLETPPYEPCA